MPKASAYKLVLPPEVYSKYLFKVNNQNNKHAFAEVMRKHFSETLLLFSSGVNGVVSPSLNSEIHPPIHPVINSEQDITLKKDSLSIIVDSQKPVAKGLVLPEPYKMQVPTDDVPTSEGEE